MIVLFTVCTLYVSFVLGDQASAKGQFNAPMNCRLNFSILLLLCTVPCAQDDFHHEVFDKERFNPSKDSVRIGTLEHSS